VISLPREKRPSAIARLTALVAIALVLFLGVLSSSPDLHERIHSHPASVAGAVHEDAADNDVGCVVTLFSQGLILALSFFALILLGRTMDEAPFAAAAQRLREDPHYRLQPTQGPPIR
jgi:hypothetical protein